MTRQMLFTDDSDLTLARKDELFKYFSTEKGPRRFSSIPTVVYHKHPEMAWLPMKEKMSLDETFRALHDAH